jgi:hypothetical protein
LPALLWVAQFFFEDLLRGYRVRIQKNPASRQDKFHQSGRADETSIVAMLGNEDLQRGTIFLNECLVGRANRI